jgi:hypothetical protein
METGLSGASILELLRVKLSVLDVRRELCPLVRVCNKTNPAAKSIESVVRRNGGERADAKLFIAMDFPFPVTTQLASL